MMKIKIIFGVALSVVLLNACSSYENTPPVQEPSNDKPIAMEHVPVEKACSILNGIISSPVVQENATRGVTVSPANATAFNAAGEMLTRADNDEARYYLMDIPELGMYAIMGAHTTVPPLLVLANGKATAEPVHEKDELKNYIANLPNTPSNWIIPIDSVSVDPIPIDTTSLDNRVVYVYDYDNATYTLLNGVLPIDMKWGQDSPYNMRSPGDYNEKGEWYDHAFVCCGAMSIAMVMTHPKYRPDITVDGHKLDWQRMWNFKYQDYATLYPEQFGGVVENHISALFELLSLPENLNVNWGQYGSTCYVDRIAPVLSKYGVSCEKNFVPYSMDLLTSEIGQGYPVIMFGTTEIRPGVKGGHAWIVSAILKAEVPYKVVPFFNEFDIALDSGIRTFNLLHHNWGWAKSNEGLDYNGYYFESDTVVSGKGLKFDENFGLVVRKPNGWGTYSDFRVYAGLRKK